MLGEGHLLRRRTFGAKNRTPCGQCVPATGVLFTACTTLDTNPYRDFGITANNAFLYYDDLDRATEFYTQTLGIEVAADYGFA